MGGRGTSRFIPNSTTRDSTKRNYPALHCYRRSWNLGRISRANLTLSRRRSQLSFHAEPRRRLGGGRQCDYTSLHCNRRSRNLEHTKCQWHSDFINRRQPHINLHAEPNQRLGRWRHSSSWLIFGRTSYSLLGWSEVVAGCYSIDPRRNYANRSHERDFEIGILFGAE